MTKSSLPAWRRLHRLSGHVICSTTAAGGSFVVGSGGLLHDPLGKSPPPGGVSSSGDSTLFQISEVKEGFGAVVEVGTAAAGSAPLTLKRLLSDPAVHEELRRVWQDFGGLLVLRNLEELSAEQLVEVTKVFGEIENVAISGRSNMQVLPNSGAVMRIGNTRDAKTGELTATFADTGPLPPDGSPRYRPEAKRPVWHTDSTFREHPPIGSILFCRQAPADGRGATCFADTRKAYDALDAPTKARLEGLECICSLAHHDAKIHTYTPSYPLLTPDQRKANPPRRVPMVLTHPLNGRKALYGMNSSTYAVLPKGQEISAEALEKADLEAVEHPSMEKEWRQTLLPYVTQDRFTYVHNWREGDLVLWDNRCTMHTATGFDHQNCTREMWRTTLVEDRRS